MHRRELPVFELEQEIVSACRGQSRFILQAPTGSGKSTQVPQILLDHGLLGRGQVVILQPRRIAARMLAARVASERNSRLGDEVGYQVRFDNVVSNRTPFGLSLKAFYFVNSFTIRSFAASPPSSSTNSTNGIFTAISPWRGRCGCKRRHAQT